VLEKGKIGGDDNTSSCSKFLSISAQIVIQQLLLKAENVSRLIHKTLNGLSNYIKFDAKDPIENVLGMAYVNISYYISLVGLYSKKIFKV
jgi:hypothetical protein